MKVKISRIDNNPAVSLPKYATNGSAGMDICAFIEQPIILESGKTVLVPTGISIALEDGYECQVRSRSGLSAKHSVFALNAPGTIDSDYRGEIKVILSNFGESPFTINNGDRIAQLVVAKYEKVIWEECSNLNETERGTGGFGSTGIS